MVIIMHDRYASDRSISYTFRLSLFKALLL